jgi:O-antigen ligase
MGYLLSITLLLAPTYAIRFSLFGLPVNVLMVWVFVLWVIFACWVVATGRLTDLAHWLRSEVRRPEALLAFLFLLAGIISLFVGGLSQEKLGQFIVLFMQPIGTFLIIRYLYSIGNWKLEIGDSLTRAALFFVAISGIYAVIQYFTLLGVPAAWWGNSEEPKRAVAFFLHPNFYALFITPLLAFLVPVVSRQWLVVSTKTESDGLVNRQSLIVNRWLSAAAWLLGAIGLLLSLSRGGWLGLAAAVGVYLLIAGNRKLIKSALIGVIVIVIVIISVPNFRYRLLLPFRGEKSSVARFSLWDTGWKMVKDDPVSGKGLLGFSNNWYTYNTDPGLQHYPAPHNIALNFWVDTGLLGLSSFFALLVLAIWRGIKNKYDAVRLGLALACIAIIIHGLIDIPYFKNDLALLFWMVFAFI